MKAIFLSASLSTLLACLSCSPQPAYLDPTRPVKERVESLMGEMSLEEKVAQLDQFASWNIQSYTADSTLLNDWGVGSWVVSTLTPEEYNKLQALSEKSRLKIPFLIGTDAAHGLAQMPGRTIFPTSISHAATFNPDLVHHIAET